MNTPPDSPAANQPAPQPVDPRRRLRELLNIPERDRTEEQWDEIVELEIQLAPGNRIGPAGGPPMKSGGQGGGPGGNPQQPRKHRTNKNPVRRPNKPGKPPREPGSN